QVIPGYVDGFLNSKYQDARAALQQFDRCAKAVTDCDNELKSLKAQPKTDVGAIHRQETLLQQQLSELESLEDQAYDTLFRVNEEQLWSTTAISGSSQRR